MTSAKIPTVQEILQSLRTEAPVVYRSNSGWANSQADYLFYNEAPEGITREVVSTLSAYMKNYLAANLEFAKELISTQENVPVFARGVYMPNTDPLASQNNCSACYGIIYREGQGDKEPVVTITVNDRTAGWASFDIADVDGKQFPRHQQDRNDNIEQLSDPSKKMYAPTAVDVALHELEQLAWDRYSHKATAAMSASVKTITERLRVMNQDHRDRLDATQADNVASTNELQRQPGELNPEIRESRCEFEPS